MVTFNFTLRSTFFTGANRTIFINIRPKNIGVGGGGIIAPLALPVPPPLLPTNHS